MLRARATGDCVPGAGPRFLARGGEPEGDPVDFGAAERLLAAADARRPGAPSPLRRLTTRRPLPMVEG